MSVDPHLLTLNTGGPEDGAREQEEEGEQAELGEDDFYVERIVDYKVCDLMELGTPLDEWETPDTRYEVRYLVNNTWEPRRNFASWQDAYDDQIAEIRRKHPKKRSVEFLEEKAARKNEGWRKNEREQEEEENKKRVKKLRKGGVSQAKKKGKKVKQEKVKQETVKQEKAKLDKGKPDKGKGKEPLRRISTERGSASPALSATGSNKASTRRTRTSRISDEWIDQEALNEFINSGNAPSELRALQATPPPKHDAEGNLIYSSSEVGSPSSQRRPSPAPTMANGAAPTQRGFAGSDDEDEDDVRMGGPGEPVGVAQPPPVSATSTSITKGFAGSDSEDEMDIDVANQPAQSRDGFARDSDEMVDFGQAEHKPVVAASRGPAAGGFAGDDDDDAGYFPALAPFPPSFSREPTSQPARVTQKGGFAGSSEEDEGGESGGFVERSRHSAAGRADLGAMPVCAGVSRSNSVDIRGFAGSGNDEKPAAAAQERPAARQVQGFAGESSDEDEPAEPVPSASLAPGRQGLARESDDDEEPAAAEQSQKGGFAGDSDEEEVKSMLQDCGDQPAAIEAASAPAAHPARTTGGFAGSDDDEEEPPPTTTAAPPDPQPQPQPLVVAHQPQPARASSVPARNDAEPSQERAAAVARSSSRSPSAAKGPAASAQKSPQPAPRGPKVSHKRSSRDEDRPTVCTSSKPPPTKKVKSSEGGRVSSESSADSRVKKGGKKKGKKAPIESTDDERPAKKKKKRRIVENDEADEADDQPRAPKAPLMQAQQILRMKFPKVDASASKASLQPVAPIEQQRQSPSISADSSSLTGSSSAQAKRAKKAQDPYNYGVAQVRYTNGFIPINADKLRMNKLDAKLREAYGVPVPAQFMPGVEQIRYMWSVGPAHGNPLDGADDFDNIMANSGRPREVYVTPPPDDSQVGVDKHARRHRIEYLALQFILWDFRNIKQADAPRDSVTACFVHASELPELGCFPGKYAGMDRLRDRPHTVFFVYGMDDQTRRRAMRQIWRPLVAITFTPSALVRNAERVCSIVEYTGGRFNPDLAARDVFPWVPLQYFLPGGAFGACIDAEGKRLTPRPEENLDHRTAKLALHSLLMMDQLAITSVMAAAEPASTSTIFPRLPDRVPYNPSVWKQFAEFYPPELCTFNLARLQKLACSWRSKYSQFRNWVIIASPDERKICAPLPGITLVDVAQAEKLFR
ncbi:hypothetical protein Rt10032_c09g3948 [Rhodotorula toruloides]|uniref:Uncharacterized protein n=1 Tax=Rhodotorula toruloides TaxID=5286 RepID=A0A511KHS7_RHOTO|nr:hypothetical protein Rt10032_c09g3948 [Rhodotorula toruloides]